MIVFIDEGGPATDPDFDKVVSLMHFDGADGSTSMVGSVFRRWSTAGTGAALSTAQSKFGSSSLLLDGTDDYIVAGQASELSLTGDFTIEAWIRPTALTRQFATIVGSNIAGFSGDAWFLMLLGNPNANAGKVQFGYPSSNPILISTTVLSTAGQWYHVAVTRSGSTMRLFIDGALEASATNSATVEISSAGVRIGSNGWDGAASFFTGYIDEFRILNGTAAYTAAFTPPASAFSDPVSSDNTKVLLHFEGSNASDKILDAAYPFYTIWTPNGGAQLDTAQSKFGGSSLLLDGDADWLRQPENRSLYFEAGVDFTIEAWIRPNSFTNNYGSIIASDQSGFLTGAVALMVQGASAPVSGQQRRVHFVTPAGSTNGSTQLNTGQWYHVAFTRSGTTGRLFLDGALEATTSGGYMSSAVSLSGVPSTGVTNKGTRIGSGQWDAAAGYFDGWIDDLRITRGLARYTSAFTPPSAAFPNS